MTENPSHDVASEFAVYCSRQKIETAAEEVLCEIKKGIKDISERKEALEKQIADKKAEVSKLLNHITKLENFYTKLDSIEKQHEEHIRKWKDEVDEVLKSYDCITRVEPSITKEECEALAKDAVSRVEVTGDSLKKLCARPNGEILDSHHYYSRY